MIVGLIDHKTLTHRKDTEYLSADEDCNSEAQLITHQFLLCFLFADKC